MEGTSFPFFGISYSIEKIMQNIDMNLQDNIDHSRESVNQAIRLGNLFVDEARLNSNFFTSRSDEAAALISNYDA